MDTKPQVSRRSIRRLNDQLRHMAQKRIAKDNGQYRIWMDRVALVERFLSQKDLPTAHSAVKRFRQNMADDGSFTPQDIYSLGNGHKKSCHCPECYLHGRTLTTMDKVKNLILGDNSGAKPRSVAN